MEGHEPFLSLKVKRLRSISRFHSYYGKKIVMIRYKYTYILYTCVHVHKGNPRRGGGEEFCLKDVCQSTTVTFMSGGIKRTANFIHIIFK